MMKKNSHVKFEIFKYVTNKKTAVNLKKIAILDFKIDSISFINIFMFDVGKGRPHFNEIIS